MSQIWAHYSTLHYTIWDKWKSKRSGVRCPNSVPILKYFRAIWFSNTKMRPTNADVMAHNVDADQTAPHEVVWSWSSMCAQPYLSQYLQFLRHKRNCLSVILHRITTVMTKLKWTMLQTTHNKTFTLPLSACSRLNNRSSHSRCKSILSLSNLLKSEHAKTKVVGL